MFSFPLIERELRVAVRKQRPARSRLYVASLAVGGSMLILLFGSLTGYRGAGQNLEQLLCLAGLYFVLRAPMLIAGVLAEERRNQTLGLLFLSGMGAGEVFAGKFLSSALIAFANLLAIFPLLALPFLVGGVSYDLFIAIICVLPVLMFFALGVSLLASVLVREDSTAVVMANVIGALLCLLTPAIYLAHSHLWPIAKPSLWWLRLSPAYGPYLIWRGFGSGFHAGQRAEFWQNLVLTLGWSALALCKAMFALKRIWREQEYEEPSGGWRKRLREFMHGNRESRQSLGREWLGENPFVWLAARDRQPSILGWLVVGGIVLAWLLCWAVWRDQWPGVMNFYLTAMLLNYVLFWLARHTAAQEIGLARRNGAYELLLTTRLDPMEIVWGELESLRQHFHGLATFVLGLDAIMMLCGLMVRQWTANALIVYFALWIGLLVWTWNLGRRMSHVLPVMWATLNSGRPSLAFLRLSGFKGWWPWIYMYYFWMGWMGRGIFRGFPSGSRIQLIFVAAFGGMFLAVWILRRTFPDHGQMSEFKWDSRAKAWRSIGFPLKPGGHYAKRLIGEFRDIVREPLPDPGDPRFKKWKPHERFPSDSARMQHRLNMLLAGRLSETV